MISILITQVILNFSFLFFLLRINQLRRSYYMDQLRMVFISCHRQLRRQKTWHDWPLMTSIKNWGIKFQTYVQNNLTEQSSFGSFFLILQVHCVHYGKNVQTKSSKCHSQQSNSFRASVFWCLGSFTYIIKSWLSLLPHFYWWYYQVYLDLFH